jgi:transcriptional regulator with XRE-family HTH domain
MSLADCNLPGTGSTGESPHEVPIPPTERPLHRLETVRRLQGVSRRAVARRLNMDLATVKQQEQETSDLLLSTLYKWQELLDVPVAELLVDSADTLAFPIMKRAQMIRLMKTALSIMEHATQVAIRRMAQMLIDQLVELMPELEGVGAWHAVGQRRRLDEYGRAAERRLSPDVFMDLMD